MSEIAQHITAERVIFFMLGFLTYPFIAAQWTFWTGVFTRTWRSFKHRAK